MAGDRDAFDRKQRDAISNEERVLIKELSNNLEQVWYADSISMEERKTLLRFLVERVLLDGMTEAGKIRIQIEWHTGSHTTTTIDRPPVGVWAPKTPEEAVKVRRDPSILAARQMYHPTCHAGSACRRHPHDAF